jgi:hypothetical protein
VTCDAWGRVTMELDSLKIQYKLPVKEQHKLKKNQKAGRRK